MGNRWTGRNSAAVATLLAAALAGCSTKTTVTTRTVLPNSAVKATWMGRSVEEVERVWGEAPERESDGEGGTVLAYRRDTSLSMTTESRDAVNRTPKGADVGDPRDPNRSSTEKITKLRARFWVNANGTVYRYWFAQEVYDEGKDTPPASSSE